MKLLTKSVFFGALIASNLLSLSLISGIPEEYEEHVRMIRIKEQKDIENLPHEQQAKIKKFLARPDIQSLRTKMDTIGRRIALGAHFPVLEKLKNTLKDTVRLLEPYHGKPAPAHNWTDDPELNKVLKKMSEHTQNQLNNLILKHMDELGDVEIQICNRQSQQLQQDLIDLEKLQLEYEQKLQEAAAQDSE